MRIVLLSDTHELHRDVDVPIGDLLIHAGDITFFSRNREALADFEDWLGEQPHRYKVVIPGNHDGLLENVAGRAQITNAHLLVDSGLNIAGLHIWGSPVTPHAHTPFGIPHPDDRTAHWAAIPHNLDILITHGPPYGVLDCAPGEELHAGDRELRRAVIRKRPRLHVFGHVHSGYGTRPTRHTLFVNAALPGELGDLENQPYVLNMAMR